MYCYTQVYWSLLPNQKQSQCFITALEDNQCTAHIFIPVYVISLVVSAIK